MNSSKLKLLDFLQSHYSLTGVLSELPSYIDVNYLLKAPTGNKYVVKITSTQTCFDEIRLENAAMLHLQKKQLSITTPRVIKSNNKESILDYQIDNDSDPTKLRVVSYLDGKLYSQSNFKDPKLQYSLGNLIAQTVEGLKDFDCPAAHRKSSWDIAQLLDLEKCLSYFESEQYHVLINGLKEFKELCHPHLRLLPQQIIHNDANDNNLIVSGTTNKLQCSGIFDFGDLVYTQRICELAIAMTYALFNCDNLLQTSKTIVNGYSSFTKLQNDECKILYYLIKARLLQSLLNSGKSYASNPDNSYLLVSAIPAWELLEKLNHIEAHVFYKNIKNK